jgi:hypothetical protein
MDSLQRETVPVFYDELQAEWKKVTLEETVGHCRHEYVNKLPNSLADSW